MIHELEDLNLDIYPNPTQGEFSIDLPDLAGILSIVDVNGRTVYRSQVNGARKSFDISNEPAGLYTVTFETTDGTNHLSKRFILQ